MREVNGGGRGIRTPKGLAARWISSPLPCQLRLALRVSRFAHFRRTVIFRYDGRAGSGRLSGYFRSTCCWHEAPHRPRADRLRSGRGILRWTSATDAPSGNWTALPDAELPGGNNEVARRLTKAALASPQPRLHRLAERDLDHDWLQQHDAALGVAARQLRPIALGNNFRPAPPTTRVHGERPWREPCSPFREAMPRNGSWLDVLMVLGLLVVLTVSWGLVSVLGVFVTVPLAYIAKLRAGLKWWGYLLVTVALGLGACAPLAVSLTIQRLHRQRSRIARPTPR